MQNIMSSMLNEISPHLRGNLDAQTLAVELLPLLLHIITPTLRPVRTFVQYFHQIHSRPVLCYFILSNTRLFYSSEERVNIDGISNCMVVFV